MDHTIPTQHTAERLRTRHSITVRYGLAILAALAAVLVRWRLVDVLGDRSAFLMFMLAVIASASFGGLGPGLLCTVLCGFGAALLWPQFAGLFTPPVLPSDVQFAMFLVGAVGVSVIGEVMLRARERAAGAIARLQEARGQLEQRVAERTVELSLANESLRSNERTLERAQQVANLGSWEWSASSNRAVLSRSMLIILGLDPSRFTVSLHAILSRVHPDDRPRVFDAARAMSRGNADHEIECRILLPGPMQRVLHTVIERMVVADGGIAKVIGVTMDITDRRRLENETLQIGERERQRIGQDLHDDLCQYLTSIALSGKLLQRRLAGKSMPEADDLEKLVQSIQQATIRARQSARELYPIHLRSAGFVAALQALSRNADSSSGIQCEVRCDTSVHLHDTAIATHLYRIAQEAVSNALRHSQGKRIVVELSHEMECIVLTIRDNGIGMPEPVSRNGMGLDIMQYRARMIGAQLIFSNAESGGVIVTCTLPWPAQEQSIVAAEG